MHIKLVDTDDRVVLHNRALFQDGQCKSQLIVPPSMPPGIYGLTAYFEEEDREQVTIAFEREFVVAGEKMILIGNSSPVNSSPTGDYQLEIGVEKDSWSPRERIDVNVAVKSDNGAHLKSVLAVSVLHEDLFDGLERGLRVLDCEASTERDGRLRSPAFFRGRVVIDSTSVDLPDSLLISFYFSINDFSYQLLADRDGHFDFPLLKPYGDEEVFYRITRKGEQVKEAKIILSNPSPAMNNDYVANYSDKLDLYFMRSIERQ
jgi:hypothetical protein